MPVRLDGLAVAKRGGPLTVEERQLADRVSRRLHEQVRTFLAAVPAEARNASGLARFLDVDRTTCQRLVFTASRPYTGLDLIDRLPGVRGMRQLIAAGRNASPPLDPEPLEAFESAVDRFENAMRTLAGSQSALVRRIASTSESPTSVASKDDPAAARRQLFDASAELTGRYSDTWVAVYVYQPDNGKGDIDVARAHGLVGHYARPDAVPLTFHNFTSKRHDHAEHPHAFRSLIDGDGRTPDTVLQPFSTNPAPVVSSRQPGEYLVQAIDTDPETGGGPIDLMLGTRNTIAHPAAQSPAIEEVWALINFPVRQMVFDVYLHRDLARLCIPALDLHLWRPDFGENVGDRWQTRFSNAPRLEVLGQGIANAKTPAYGRHAELTGFLFQHLKLDSERFIGYRCTVQYPIWRTGYCMSFDFSAGEDA